jgi:TATA-binding protein-associated factor
MKYMAEHRQAELPNVVHPQLLATWLHLLLTPIGTPLEINLILSGRSILVERTSVSSQPQSHTWHNVDAAMLKQDLSLVEYDIVLAARIAAATALGQLLTAWPPEVSYI